MQEAITLVVFVVFSRLFLGERLSPRHAASFALIFAAVVIGFKE
jgi:uncharacterized protein (DUF486 family)